MINKEYDCFMHNVAWLRIKHGLSKRKMARILGIGLQTLNKIENGEIPPNLSVDVVFEIYSNFGVSPKNLFGNRLE